jgi:hypothetical protein
VIYPGFRRSIRTLLRPARHRQRRTDAIRGLSTAELVGIIVIVGVLGALSGTYVKGLVTQASTAGGDQNATTLNGTVSTAFSAGASVGTGAGQVDTSSAANAIAALNVGVTVNGVLYKMTPPIDAGSIASYSMSGVGTSNVVFSYVGPTP